MRHRHRQHWTQDTEQWTIMRHRQHWTQDTEQWTIMRHRQHWTQDSVDNHRLKTQNSGQS